MTSIEINRPAVVNRFARLAAIVAASGLLCACAAGTGAAEPGGTPFWSAASYGVSATKLPSGWSVASSDDTRLGLAKRFENADGIWYDETLTLTVTRGNFDALSDAVASANGRGFGVVERDRIGLARDSAPYWLMHRDAGADESDWVALVLHGGTILVADLRSTPLDAAGPRDLMEFLGGIGLAGRREEAWDLLDRGAPDRALPVFRYLVDADSGDANARYGLALSELAQGNSAKAAAELKALAPLLGLSDDVRRAIGRAEFDLGDKDRAAALWTQVLRSDSGWEPDVRPSLGAATRDAPAPSAVESDQLVAIAVQFISLLDAGEEIKATQLQLGFREVFDHALEACAAGRCGMRGGLLAAYDMERGMTLAMNGLQNDDADRTYEGKLKIADGLRAMAAQEAPGESQ